MEDKIKDILASNKFNDLYDNKCGYCNLFSLQTNRADYIATYLETLHKQAQQLSPLTTGLAFDSFAIGGGTPLLLTVPQLEYLLDTAA